MLQEKAIRTRTEVEIRLLQLLEEFPDIRGRRYEFGDLVIWMKALAIIYIILMIVHYPTVTSIHLAHSLKETSTCQHVFPPGPEAFVSRLQLNGAVFVFCFLFSII